MIEVMEPNSHNFIRRIHHGVPVFYTNSSLRIPNIGICSPIYFFLCCMSTTRLSISSSYDNSPNDTTLIISQNYVYSWTYCFTVINFLWSFECLEASQ